MVRILVKYGDVSEEKEFLYDSAITALVDEISTEVVRISNLQSKINRLVLELEPRLRPLHGEPKAMPLIRALSEAKSYASKDQVTHNRPLSFYVLRDHVQAIEREFMTKIELLSFSDINQFQQLLTGLGLLQEDSTQLQWAGKELMRGKPLCDYIGKNEKTKIVLKLRSLVSVAT